MKCAVNGVAQVGGESVRSGDVAGGGVDVFSHLGGSVKDVVDNACLSESLCAYESEGLGDEEFGCGGCAA